MPYPIKEKLLEIPVMKEQSEEVINWLLEKTEYRHASPGEYFFKKGDKVEHMIILLEGEIHFMLEAGGNFLKTGSASNGDITGVLPFSRMKEAGGTSEVARETHCLALHKKYFQELEKLSPELIQQLVGMMSDRVRHFTVKQQQREKMEALGKLSAGIAHEMNNPASAIRSTSREIQKHWKELERLNLELMTLGLDSGKLRDSQEILSQNQSSKLSILEKSNQEEELIDFFDDLEFEDSMELAESMVEIAIGPDQVKKVAELIDPSSLESFLKWFVLSHSVEEMIEDIHNASERITTLVNSVKSHSHMDRAPEEAALDIRKGIESTLVIFQHKIKDKSISLDLNFDESLPEIKGYEGELNQVWTNIIDNALDALDEKGKLSIEAFAQNAYIKIRIKDNGPGIPEEIQNQVFEPFFTTKEMGKGTGLGLDISSRIIKSHNGEIDLSSKVGETIFEIRLPIKDQ